MPMRLWRCAIPCCVWSRDIRPGSAVLAEGGTVLCWQSGCYQSMWPPRTCGGCVQTCGCCGVEGVHIHVANPHLWLRIQTCGVSGSCVQTCGLSGGCAAITVKRHPLLRVVRHQPTRQQRVGRKGFVRMLHLLKYVVRRAWACAVKCCWVDRSTVDRPWGARLVSGLTKCIHQGMTSQRGAGPLVCPSTGTQGVCPKP